jgi:hypothetical protein
MLTIEVSEGAVGDQWQVTGWWCGLTMVAPLEPQAAGGAGGAELETKYRGGHKAS